jgi:hypothetical protein
MLNNDFNSLERYTDTTSTTVYPLTQDTFPNRGYYKLELLEGEIDTVLGKGSLGSILEILFRQSSGENPVLILNGIEYILQRAVKGGPSSPSINFTPMPNRNFLNHQDLYNISNAIPSQNGIRNNADVYGGTLTSPRYTYVSFYIVAQGTSLDMPPQTIFSQPTFLGIFQLANAN